MKSGHKITYINSMMYTLLKNTYAVIKPDWLLHNFITALLISIDNSSLLHRSFAKFYISEMIRSYYCNPTILQMVTGFVV